AKRWHRRSVRISRREAVHRRKIRIGSGRRPGTLQGGSRLDHYALSPGGGGMSENSEARLLMRLRALLEAVAEEARINPSFAANAEAALAQAEAILNAQQWPAGQQPKPADAGKNHTILKNVTFDPLECQIEAAIISGREREAREFLGKLNRTQLEEVVRAQR